MTVRRFSVRSDTPGTSLNETVLTIPNKTNFDLQPCDVIEFSIAQTHYTLVVCSSVTPINSVISDSSSLLNNLTSNDTFPVTFLLTEDCLELPDSEKLQVSVFHDIFISVC